MFSKEYINMLLTVYFCGIGALAFGRAVIPWVRAYFPDLFPNCEFFVKIDYRDMKPRGNDSSNEEAEQTEENSNDSQSQGNDRQEYYSFDFQKKDLIAYGLGAAIGLHYLFKKHWIANNLFGIAFSINAIELLHLNKITTGITLLSGLFVYDVFWVFATDVMLLVAKGLEAPIKVIFPRNIFIGPLSPKDFSMLGLGDIVIPGIFIALLLRYDNKLKPGSCVYFITGFIAYIVGLLTTMIVMHFFQHGQPALLYLVPTCVGFPLFLALIRGDLATMFEYKDNPEEESKKDK